MRKIREAQTNDRVGFKDLVRGRRLSNGAVTSVNAPTKAVNNSAATFLTDGVDSTCYFVNLTLNRAAKIVSVPLETRVILDEWIPTLATHQYIIISNPMLAKHLFSIESRVGMPIVYVDQDDGIAREVRVQRTLCTWLMATGGANADRSQAFYVPPGVDKVTIELPFTHGADIAVHRYHGDWLSKVAADAELLPSGVADWAVWPGGSVLILVANPVPAGTYALERLYDGAGDFVVFDVHPGWYRLVSTAAGADKTFTVCYEIP